MKCMNRFQRICGITAIALSLTSCDNMQSWKIIDKENQSAKKIPEIMFLPVEPYIAFETGDSTMVGESHTLVLRGEQIIPARGIPFSLPITKRVDVTREVYNSSNIGDSYTFR